MEIQVRLISLILVFALGFSFTGCASFSRSEPLAIPEKGADFEKFKLDETTVWSAGDHYQRGDDFYTKSQVKDLFKTVSPSAYDKNQKAIILRTVSYVALGLFTASFIYGVSRNDFNRAQYPFYGGLGIAASTAFWSAFTVQSAARTYNEDLKKY